MVDHLDATESRYFFYDELDRLQKATALDGTTLHQYGYDTVGNRTSKLGPLGSNTTYSYEASSDRLDAASGAEARDYAHDAYGNRIYDGASAFAGTPSLVYDEANRLVTVRDPANGFATLATYTYDAFGRRVKKVTATKTLLFLYDTQGHLALEIDKVGNDITNSNNDKVRTYVFLEDELLGVLDEVGEVGSAAWSTPLGGIELEPPLLVLALSLVAGLGVAAATRRWPVAIATASSGLVILFFCAGIPRPAPRYTWIHTDPLGTPLAATNVPAMGNAVAVWRAKYEPFGKATVDENPDGDSVTFTLNVRFPGSTSMRRRGGTSTVSETTTPRRGATSRRTHLDGSVGSTPTNTRNRLRATELTRQVFGQVPTFRCLVISSSAVGSPWTSLCGAPTTCRIRRSHSRCSNWDSGSTKRRRLAWAPAKARASPWIRRDNSTFRVSIRSGQDPITLKSRSVPPLATVAVCR